MIADLPPWQLQGLLRALDYLEGTERPEAGPLHLVFHAAKIGAKRQGHVLTAAAALVSGRVAHVAGHRPRHLPDETPTMTIAATRDDAAASVLADAKAVAMAYGLAHLTLDFRPGRHE